MKKSYLPVLLSILLMSCSNGTKINSGIIIPAYQEFQLGEDISEAFNVELTNESEFLITIETRDQQNHKTSSFGFDPGGKTNIYVDPNQKAVIINPNAESVKVSARLAQDVQGMQYHVLDFGKIDGSESFQVPDMSAMISDSWTGELIYSDYQSGERVSIPCNLKVAQTDLETYQMIYLYPEEPHANDTSEIVIDFNNRIMGDQKIVEVQSDESETTISTIKKGTDNNKEAVLFYTYRFTESTLIMRKEFQTVGSEELRFRNEYRFEK